MQCDPHLIRHGVPFRNTPEGASDGFTSIAEARGRPIGADCRLLDDNPVELVQHFRTVYYLAWSRTVTAVSNTT